MRGQKFSKSVSIILIAKKVNLAIFLSVTATACGGGGGGDRLEVPTQPPANTSPPPAPPALSIVADVPNQPVLDGNLFIIEVSNDSGSSLAGSSNVEITQVGGPTAQELDNSASATSTWMAPDVDFDTTDQMVFEITATNDANVSTVVTLEVDFRGFSGPGAPVALFEPGFELLAGSIGVPLTIGNSNSSFSGNIGSLPQFPDSSNSPRQFVFFGGNLHGFDSYRIDDVISSDEVFSEASFFGVGTLTFNLQGNAGSGSNFVLLDESDDLFRYFVVSGSSPPLCCI